MKRKVESLFFPHDGKKEHFKALDGLRGVAVLLVLLSHSSNEDLFFIEYLNFSRTGKIGVYLFFVLSAYLLDRQIALAFIAKKASRSYWKNYFFRRFLRIYPLFAIALLFYGTLNYLGYGTEIDKLQDIPAHLLLLKGESIFWSIPPEFKYYFFSPILIWFFHKVLAWNTTSVWITLVTLIILAIAIELNFQLSLVSTLRYFPIFLVGTSVALYELFGKDTIVQKSWQTFFSALGLIALVLLTLTIPYYYEIIFKDKPNFHHSIFYFPYAVLWGIILMASKYGKGAIKWALEIKILRFIGTISFSLYLFHVPVLRFIKTNIGIPDGLKIYLFFILSFLTAIVSYLLIERPLSKIKLYRSNLLKEDLKILPSTKKHKNQGQCKED